MCMRLYGMIENNKKKETNKQTITFVLKTEGIFYFGGGAVERYRADIGLSTFNDGRGIFDWNVAVPTTDGETPRPVRFPWVCNVGLGTTSGLFVVPIGVANTSDKRGRRAGDWCLFSGNFAVTAEEGVFVLVKKALNFLDIVERNVSFDDDGGTIACVKFFEVRRDMVITQSRALVFVEWVLIMDVLSWSSLSDEIFGAWYVKRNASGVSFSNCVIIRSNRLNVDDIATSIRASGDW